MKFSGSMFYEINLLNGVDVRSIHYDFFKYIQEINEYFYFTPFILIVNCSRVVGAVVFVLI